MLSFQAVKDNKVMVFMKGTHEQPQCGFGGQVVRILHAEGAEFASHDVLEDWDLREGIKSSRIGRFLQVYIDGEFVGGCDVMTSLYQSGELEEMLKVNKHDYIISFSSSINGPHAPDIFFLALFFSLSLYASKFILKILRPH